MIFSSIFMDSLIALERLEKKSLNTDLKTLPLLRRTRWQKSTVSRPIHRVFMIMTGSFLS